MRIPKYVQKLIDRRCKLAWDLMAVSAELDDWLMTHGIPVGNDYTTTGCLIYCEPDVAKQCVEEEILNKE